LNKPAPLLPGSGKKPHAIPGDGKAFAGLEPNGRLDEKTPIIRLH
jgi:hypothetical protein